jgi:hypothetical protein
MESTTIAIVKKAVASCVSSGRKKLKLASEHPDHRLVRMHRAADMANCNLENTKIKARNLGGLRS